MDQDSNEHHARYEAMAAEMGVPYVDLTVYKPHREALDSLGGDIARRYQILPLIRAQPKSGGGEVLFVATSNVHDLLALDAVRLDARCQVRPVLAVPELVSAAIERLYERQ